ncbi:hypothetical protein [Natronorubrum daqingense]|uniref:Uncharacterized protein n=1 Tax=Natronorubrum daqingense TaxID=588898 RepID=A0A1N6YAL7_9EURY|nr:hypothetical protein [Natronorubrum daqingense]APX95726.1 hypothetical protein BB347_03340 [Natronorubrum daqingense]SIR11531.1 hypothetical protein SAMN05421809_0376 [Natronorubrum daqingense]
MEITATVDYGTLEIELSSDEREEVQQNLLEVIDFLEENNEAFKGLDLTVQNGSSQTELSATEWSNNDGQQEQSKDDGSSLKSLARKFDVTIEAINEIVFVDPFGEERPQLMANSEQLGSSVPERQRHAAFIILTVLEECYDEEEIETAEFKELLTFAGISDGNLYRAWDDSLFQTGKGRSAKVSLKGPGKREAKKYLKALLESNAK